MHKLNLLWAAKNEEVLNRRRKRYSLRKCLELIHEMPDLLFIERYRFDKQSFMSLCRELKLAGLRGTKEIPVEIKVLCALSFLATGSYQRIVGLSQQLLQRSASRCIRQVVDALNHPNIMRKWIVFPQTQSARNVIKQEFQRKFHLPGVIGCIDCTHIAIVKPNEEEHLFFNRKGYHSINVQMICDHNLKILHVNAKFGGATHDAYIFGSSEVEPYMRGLHQNGEQVWLLGDSGYPQRSWLMTPVLNAARGSLEETYTNRHVQARNCIERCFGLLKSRWRCLLKDRTLHYHPQVASKITLACCVLHNIAIEARLPPPRLAPHVDNDDDENFNQQGNISTAGSQNDLILGRAMLNSLINNLLQY